MSQTQTAVDAPVYPSCEIPGFSLGCGHLGNGLSIWNRAVEVRGDYQMIAHISENGEVISWRKKDLPKEPTQYVLDWSQRMKMLYAEKVKEQADSLAKHKDWLRGIGYTEEQLKRVH